MKVLRRFGGKVVTRWTFAVAEVRKSLERAHELRIEKRGTAS